MQDFILNLILNHRSEIKVISLEKLDFKFAKDFVVKLQVMTVFDALCVSSYTIVAIQTARK